MTAKPDLRLVWNRDWINQLAQLPAPGTFMDAVLTSAYEAAANPNRGPLPADEMEDFKEKVRALHA
jgi:hypothetical protein